LRVEATEFRGVAAVELSHGDAAAVVTTAFGPRVASFTSGDRPNLLAWLPDAGIELAGKGTFSFYGGHRVWTAPEVPSWTYDPDDGDVTVEELDDRVRFSAPPNRAPIRRFIELSFEGSKLVVNHLLRNERDRDVDLAVWAITQFDPGGTGLLPLPTAPLDPEGLQASRSIVGWPYTDFADPQISIGGDAITVETGRTTPVKLGVELHRGWLAYVRSHTAFVKRAPHYIGARYVDLGASGQCYCNDIFLELETLSPSWQIEPGDTNQHRETWELLTVDPGLPVRQLAPLFDDTAVA
jgi:hypothetical protein